MNALDQLARDLQHAATVGAAEAGQGAVQAGAMQAEANLRLPGSAGVTVSGLGGMSARVGLNQRRGVYQEATPAGRLDVDTSQVADTMGDVAAALGAKALHGDHS